MTDPSSSPVSIPPSDPVESEARKQAWKVVVADQFRKKGWAVVVDPAPEQLPVDLRDFRPTMIARRGDENIVIEIRGLLPPGTGPVSHPLDPLVALATRIAQMPGWELELIWTGDDQPPAPASVLADRARRAAVLAETDVEAALPLAWSALEGVLATQFDQVGMRHHRGMALVGQLCSRGYIDDSTHTLLRDIHRLRAPIAHGRRAPADRAVVHQLVELASSTTFAA